MFSYGLAFAAILALMQANPSQRSIDEAMKTGEALQKKGDYAGAIERFRWCAASSLENAIQKDAATCEQLIGGIERLQGNYPEAEAHYREALTRATAMGDQTRISIVLNNLANLYGAQGRYGETIAMLKRCLEIDEREGITNDAAPYQNLGIAYALQGDHARALISLLAALRIYKQIGSKSKIALVHHNLGTLQIKQGNYGAAKRELEQAIAMGEEAGDQYVIVTATGDLGRVLDLNGESSAALAMFQRALSACTKSGFKSCRGESEMNLGNFRLAHHELESASESFQRAQEVFESLNDSYNLAQTLRGEGYVEHLQKEFSKATGHATRAWTLSTQIGDPDGVWQAKALLGLIAKDSGDLVRARNEYTEAIRTIEAQRGKVGGGEAEQQRFFEKAVYPFQQLALLEAVDRRPLAALRAAESARARTLLDMISSDPERLSRAMTDSESAEETRLLATIAGLNARAARAAAAQKTSVASAQETAWSKYEAFRAELYVKHPELRSWRGETAVITEEEIVGLIPDTQTAAVEFVCATDETLLLIATRGADPLRPSVSAFRIRLSRDEIQRRAAAFRTLLEQRDPGFRAQARSLYGALLEPAAALLKGKTKIQLIADGPLWNLPFQALVDASGKYWIENVTLAWAPSLTFLRDQSSGHSASGKLQLLAFGDPVAPGSPAVPVLRMQVERIGALYPGSAVVRTGSQANEAAFRELAPQARVIHIASHGIADSDNALRSRLLLAPSPTPAEKSSSEDGWLEAWELMRMDLHADLAVLSACETGRGRVADGEGLVGLTWALFVSGVRTSVVSQWRVEAQSTTDLMTAMHRNLRMGQSPANALRGATLGLMKDARYRHPFYWGAFVATGRL